MLRELKEKEAGNVMLIPIAADNEITTIYLLLKAYNVTELPSILIDEKIKLTDSETLDELETYLK